jgi:CobQ-like glutamine amidotransferase family enzyme
MTKLTLAYLYPREMNTYGDRGNVICLQKRLEWRGYKLDIVEHQPGDKLPVQVDMVFMGGGQDSGQAVIDTDFRRVAPWLRELAEADVPMLTICGAYQLFGHSFEMLDGSELQGIGILDVTTRAQTTRLIGNLHIETEDFGTIIGFENHSGRTYLGPRAEPLGRVTMGAGNNGEDKTEGTRYRNIIGTYSHGPVLPKNPRLADWLIGRMPGIMSTKLEPLDDPYIDAARASAGARPR